MTAANRKQRMARNWRRHIRTVAEQDAFNDARQRVGARAIEKASHGEPHGFRGTLLRISAIRGQTPSRLGRHR